MDGWVAGGSIDGSEHAPSRAASLNFLSMVILCALTLGW